MSENRLVSLREAFPRRQRPLLMTALVAGDPFLGATADYLRACVEGGADMIELLLPFSDPTFHGPVMRRACAHAMNEEVTIEDLAGLIAEFRQEPDGEDIPLVVSTYANRVLPRDFRAVVRSLAAAGADALMIIDLPFEASASVRTILEGEGLYLIQQLSQTTSLKRLREIVKEAKGFFVWTGHAGSEVSVSDEVFRAQMKEIRTNSLIPVVASMDISSSEDAVMIANNAHGVLVGSALAWLIEGKGPGVEERLRAFVADLRVSLDAEALG